MHFLYCESPLLTTNNYCHFYETKVKTVTKLVKIREVRHIGPDGQPVDLEFAAGPPSDFIEYPPHPGHQPHPSHSSFLPEGADGPMNYFEGQPPSPANYDAYYGRPQATAGPAGYPPGANFQVHPIHFNPLCIPFERRAMKRHIRVSDIYIYIFISRSRLSHPHYVLCLTRSGPCSVSSCRSMSITRQWLDASHLLRSSRNLLHILMQPYFLQEVLQLRATMSSIQHLLHHNRGTPRLTEE